MMTPDGAAGHEDSSLSATDRASYRAARAVLHPEGDPLQPVTLSPIGRILLEQERRRLAKGVEEGQ